MPTVNIETLRIDEILYEFVNREAMPGTGVEEKPFWDGFATLVRNLAPRNAALLQRRDELQSKIDAWHRRIPVPASTTHSTRRIWREIGYLAARAGTIRHRHRRRRCGNRPDRRAAIGGAGQQCALRAERRQCALGKPVRRAVRHRRHCARKAHRRGGAYDPQRGAQVIAFARDFLDSNFPLAEGSHRDAVGYRPDCAGTRRSIEERRRDFA